METISLKMDESLLTEIDRVMKKSRYSTRTEFIRDAIRRTISQLEKEEALLKLAQMRGCMKGKARMSEEEARDKAIKALYAKHNIPLE